MKLPKSTQISCPQPSLALRKWHPLVITQWLFLLCLSADTLLQRASLSHIFSITMDSRIYYYYSVYHNPSLLFFLRLELSQMWPVGCPSSHLRGLGHSLCTFLLYVTILLAPRVGLVISTGSPGSFYGR